MRQAVRGIQLGSASNALSSPMYGAFGASAINSVVVVRQ
jgi:hypothetical protein